MRSREELLNDDVEAGLQRPKAATQRQPWPVGYDEINGYAVQQPSGLQPDRLATFRLTSQMREYHRLFKRRWARSSAVPPFPRRPFYAPEASYAKWYRSLPPAAQRAEQVKYGMGEEELLGVQR